MATMRIQLSGGEAGGLGVDVTENQKKVIVSIGQKTVTREEVVVDPETNEETVTQIEEVIPEAVESKKGFIYEIRDGVGIFSGETE